MFCKGPSCSLSCVLSCNSNAVVWVTFVVLLIVCACVISRAPGQLNKGEAIPRQPWSLPCAVTSPLLPLAYIAGTSALQGLWQCCLEVILRNPISVPPRFLG